MKLEGMKENFKNKSSYKKSRRSSSMRKAQMKYLTAYWITLLEVKYVLEREVMMTLSCPPTEGQRR